MATASEPENLIDIGNGHFLSFAGWAPDRELNPKYVGIPDVEKYGATIYHDDPQGRPCVGFVTFSGDVQRLIEPNRPNVWDVISWDPLTISPSVLCSCGDHDFIREGRWIHA